MTPETPPLELILARNLIVGTLTPGFVIDEAGTMIYFNEAAGQLIGHRFEDTGRLSREEWSDIGPVDECGNPIEGHAAFLTIALRDHRAAMKRFRIRTDQDTLMEVEAAAVPLFGAGGFCGVIVSFVPAEVADGDRLPDEDCRPLPKAAHAPAHAGGER